MEHNEPWTPEMDRVLRLISQLYSTRDGVIGGPLHCALDDGNIEDDSPCLKLDYSSGDWEDEAGLRVICDELHPLLIALTEVQRYQVVSWWGEIYYSRFSRR